MATRGYTGATYKHALDPRGTAIGDFTMFDPESGLVIERDESQGRLDGFKAIFEIKFQGNGKIVDKQLAVDLLKIADPRRISEPAELGDVGIGEHFALPFGTIEGLYIINRRTIGVLNDNNFPFSVGRHVESGKPDDNELILARLEKPLSAPVRSTGSRLIPRSTAMGTASTSHSISELDFDATGQTAQHRPTRFARQTSRGRCERTNTTAGLWLSETGVFGAQRVRGPKAR